MISVLGHGGITSVRVTDGHRVARVHMVRHHPGRDGRDEDQVAALDAAAVALEALDRVLRTRSS